MGIPDTVSGEPESGLLRAPVVLSPSTSIDSRLSPIARCVALVVFLALAAAASAVLPFSARFGDFANPELRAAVGGITLFAWFLSALALILFPVQRGGSRLAWIALGLVIGSETVLFGYFYPHIGSRVTLSGAVIARLIPWAVACCLFAVAEVPRNVVAFKWRWALPILALTAVLYVLALDLGGHVTWALSGGPGLSLKFAVTQEFPDVTLPYRLLTIVPLGLTGCAVIAMARRGVRRPFERWILVALFVMTASQLRQAVGPSHTNPFGLMSPLSQLGLAVVLGVGSVIELRRVVSRWSYSLTNERVQRRQLSDLAMLKANFSSMAAHELGAHTAAVARLVDVAQTGDLDETQRQEVIAAIKSESEILTALVGDVSMGAAAEQDEVNVQTAPVPIMRILDNAIAFARTLPGEHPIRSTGLQSYYVLADERRIEQVLGNLLSNAAKYSTNGSPIDLRVYPLEGCVRIEIVDYGFGIQSDDLQRIFERFGRGREAQGIGGLGLGLYISRRIVRSHGSDLTVVSTPGMGSVFGFELAIAQ